MGLVNKLKQAEEKKESTFTTQNTPVEPTLSLSLKEIEFIITTLGESTVQIKQIESVYHLLLKLQKYYVEKKQADDRSN